MFTNLQPEIIINLFNKEKTIDILVITGDNDNFGKSLFVFVRIYKSIFEKGGVSIIISIDIILENIYKNTKIEFKLLDE